MSLIQPFSFPLFSGSELAVRSQLTLYCIVCSTIQIPRNLNFTSIIFSAKKREYTLTDTHSVY